MAKKTKTAAVEDPSAKLRIEYVAANTIHNNSYNPNKMSEFEFELLRRSITDDGFTQPVLAQASTADIVDGEHRWTAALVVEYLRRHPVADVRAPAEAVRLRASRAMLLAEVGDVEIPVVFVQMTPAQARIATLRHNRARGDENMELTAAVMRELQELGELGFATESLMLGEVELQRLLAGFEEEAKEAAKRYPAGEGGGADDEGEEKAVDKVIGGTPDAEQLKDHYDREEKDAKDARNDSIYRVSLIFTGDDARVVKEALGSDNPALVLASLCRQELDRRGT